MYRKTRDRADEIIEYWQKQIDQDFKQAGGDTSVAVLVQNAILTELIYIRVLLERMAKEG